MPPPGGTSDKLGNRYEALWAFDQLLRIVEGTARDLTLEPLDKDESRGIEFRLTNADGTIEFWSVKRQTTKAGWTLDGKVRQVDEDVSTSALVGRRRIFTGGVLRFILRARSAAK